jgi:hypothetical protein
MAASLLLTAPTFLAADALPLPGANAQVLTRAYDGVGVQAPFTLTLGTSGSSTDGTASVSADLTTGLWKMFFEGTGFPSATATGFEFVTFSSDASVSYNFAVDGTLNNLSTIGAVQAGGIVNIYDVTGMGPNYFTTVPGGFQFINASPLTGSASAQVVVHGSGFDPTVFFGNPLPAGLTTIESDDGSDVPVSMDITGTVSVQAGHIYAIAVVLAGGTLVGDTALRGVDFGNTGAFNFTDLGGAVVTSSSGQFLVNAPRQVPEPATLTLLGLGLAALVTRRRRN